MKKATAFTCIMICSFAMTFAQPNKGEIDSSKTPQPIQHYQTEYTFDTVVDANRWSSQQPGMHVSFASTDQLYFRREVPDINESKIWEGIGWRGERVNTTLLVWSPDPLQQAQVTVSNLTGPGGQVISNKNVQVNLVRYVVSNFPYNATNTNCYLSPNKNGYLMPDRFDIPDEFEVPGKTVRPIWISIDIPATAKPGDYKGTVEVKAEGYQTSLQLSIKVQNLVLPAPHEWKYRLDLWQNPWVVAWHYNLVPWSPEHKALLKKHLQLYANAGGKYITTYAVHSPWSDNSYMIEGGMIEWIKQKNGSWKFDYNIFDQYVQLAMEAGIDKAITLYTPIPWGFRFRYRDAQTGLYKEESWAPESKEFKSAWNAFLTDLRSHLQSKGWLNKTYLGINENEMEQTLAAIKVIKAHSKKWRITYAGNWHPELDTLLDDYSFLYGQEPTMQQQQARAKRGSSSTFYVCCNPAKPNNFVFSPPAEGRWISWYSAAYGYDGFLRWAYDAWPADPARDARHTIWPAGDCFLVYPGGGSSIRFEKLREGISDYEKIRILKQQAAQSSNSKVKSLLKQLDDHLQTFVNEHEFSTDKVKEEVNTGIKLVNELSDALAK